MFWVEACSHMDVINNQTVHVLRKLIQQVFELPPAEECLVKVWDIDVILLTPLPEQTNLSWSSLFSRSLDLVQYIFSYRCQI